MKRFLLALITMLLSVGIATADVIEKTYHFSDPQITNVDDYQQISFENTMLTGLAGEPMLPYLSISLLLPPGHAAREIEIIPGEEVFLEGNFTIYPMQHSQPMSKGGSGVFVLKEDVYQTNAAYPEQMRGEITTQFMNGYALALSSFTPLRYNPATGQVSYFKSIVVKILTSQDQKSMMALQNLRSSETIKSRLGSIAQNSEALFSYPQTDGRSDDYDLLIITSTTFATGFEELVDFYAPRGIRAQVAATTDIYATTPGQDNPEKIRNYIIQQYQDHGIQHVTLGGDVEHVPYRGFYCHVQSSSVYEDDNIPSDLYFSGLDGTWNDNGNNLWGEIGEDDLLPEIGIGRFSVSNQTEFEALMHKTIQYQQSPVTGELDNPLLVGEWLYSNPTTYGSDYLELLIGYQDENGYQTNGIPEDQNIEKLYESEGSWSASTLMSTMNQGTSFIHHVGHANSNYTMKFYNSDITNTNFAPLDGITHNYALIFSHGCICGAFDDNDCIAEKMISIEKMSVAVYMNSRYGWFNEGQTEGPAAHLNRELVDAFYDKKESHLGMAYTMARIETAPWVTAPGQWEEGALRWNFYDCNLIGDACVRFWADEPSEISATYQEALPLGVPSISISVSGSGVIEGLYCHFMKNGMSYGVAQTDAAGQAEIIFTDPITEVGEATIFVSGYNTQLHEYPLMIVPNQGAYVVYASSEINDASGNNNGQADYTESILLTTELENVGTVQADNVVATLSSSDAFVTITDNSETYGNIPGETSLSIADAFAFDIAGNVPDQHAIAFTIDAAGQDTWSSGFAIIANAPALAVGSYYFDDVSGNNNGILDPGETANMVIMGLNNGHAGAYDVTAMLTSADQYITVNTSSAQELGNLMAGGQSDATFSVTADANVPAGYTASLNIVFEALYGISVDGEIALNFTDYCFPSASCSFGDGFDGFSLESINNMNNGCSSDNGVEGYGDFTDLSTSLEPGQTYTVSWQTSYDDQQASLWIDLNSNKEFEDNERLITDFNLANSGQVYNTDFTIPEAVNGGIKRLRIRAQWLESSSDACADWSYGETEDYTVDLGDGVLSVNLACDPPQICEGGSSQLYAYCNGGSGNYTYLWSPATGLSDPTIYNPIATPVTTTMYTCEVNDGVSSMSAMMELVVNPKPAAPFINLEGETLYSDATEGNQWYDSQGMIAGATGQSYTCQWEDVYHVIVTNGFGCESDPSNSIHVVVSGVLDVGASRNLSVYPNPYSDKVFVEFKLQQGTEYKLAVYNSLGQEIQIVSENQSATGDKEVVEISASGFEKGIYFCKLITTDEVLIHKMIHNN